MICTHDGSSPYYPVWSRFPATVVALLQFVTEKNATFFYMFSIAVEDTVKTPNATGVLLQRALGLRLTKLHHYEHLLPLPTTIKKP